MNKLLGEKLKIRDINVMGKGGGQGPFGSVKGGAA